MTGFKMARRTGGIEEFQFEPIGENHQQGVRLFCLVGFPSLWAQTFVYNCYHEDALAWIVLLHYG